MTEDNTPDKLDQTVNIEEVGPARKKVSIEIPEARIADKLAENFKDLQTEAVLPGFRRGRAPQRLIEKRFGGDVRKEVKTQIMSESFQQVVEEHNLRVLGEPEVKDIETIELPDSGSLSFEIEVEVTPEFELPEFGDIKVTKTTVPVTDEQVDTEVDRFCEMQGQMKPTDEKIDVQDYVTTDLVIKNGDGETVIEKEEHIYVPGESRKFKGVVSGIIVENLGKEMIGKQVGDAFTANATGPKNHEDEALREAELSLELTIRKVERMEKASVEDILPLFGFEDEDALREQIKGNLSQRAEADAMSDLHTQVIDQLLEKIDLDLPEGMTGRQAERVLQRRQLDLMYRGVEPQEIEQQLAELREDSKAEAAKEMKSFFILDKAAEKLEVQVGEAEINGRIAQMAMQQNRRPEKLRQEMAKSGGLEQLYIQLRDYNTVTKILESASVTEVEGESPKPKTTKKKTTKKKTAKKAEAESDDKPEAKKKTTKKKTTKKKTTKKKSD